MTNLRIALGGLTVIGLAALLPTTALACSCMRQKPEDQVQMAQAIFVGVPVRTQSMGGKDRMTTFRVVSSLKGKGAVRYIYHFEDDGANCGINFRSSKPILITAELIEGKLRTNACAMPQASEAEFRAILSGNRKSK